MDIQTVTMTAKAIADMNVNAQFTMVILAVIAIINAIAIFLPKK